MSNIFHANFNVHSQTDSYGLLKTVTIIYKTLNEKLMCHAKCIIEKPN